MKVGVLIFSYAGMEWFAQSLDQDGHISINLGDYMQTLAARNLFDSLGVDRSNVIAVDRDTHASTQHALRTGASHVHYRALKHAVTRTHPASRILRSQKCVSGRCVPTI